MPEVDVFLIGVPKAGTTWLAYTLDQHHSIALSDPKEPNIIASHRGTFLRSNEEPDWSKFDTLFSEKGLKLDASIHAFACPLSPARIKLRIPQAKFILCLREPVSRSFSHWNMIQNTKESVDNGVDWSTFEKAWSDNRLRDDSMYGESMSRWLKEFNLDHFLIIDSEILKTDPMSILKKIEEVIDDGYSVCIWHDRRVEGLKDINDMIMNGMTQNEIVEVINSCTYSGLSAKLKLQEYKKT